ncbi:MAG: hypothetical protein FRX49_08112 [Trebouxia sp. A1-2]|nr:MAG: hypothetical protein FRX49_08112 [Trebouxia sp. A1-2]
MESGRVGPMTSGGLGAIRVQGRAQWALEASDSREVARLKRSSSSCTACPPATATTPACSFRKERNILECAQLSFVIVHALIAHFPQGILQLITAEQQLSPGLRAAPEVGEVHASHSSIVTRVGVALPPEQGKDLGHAGQMLPATHDTGIP